MRLPASADALEPDVVVRLLEFVSRPVEIARHRRPPGPRGAGYLVVAEAAVVVEEEDGPGSELEGAQRPLAGVVFETADVVEGELDRGLRGPPAEALPQRLLVTLAEVIPSARRGEQVEQGPRLVRRMALAVVAGHLVERLFGQAMRDLDLANQSVYVTEDLVEVAQEEGVKVGLGAAHIQHQADFIHYKDALQRRVL